MIKLTKHMSHSKSSPRIIIDTNILIGFNDYAPQNIHPIFWKRLSKVVEDDKIIIIKNVALECKFGYIKYWLESPVISKKIIEVEPSVERRATQINEQYKMTTIAGGRKKSKADSRVIAYAESRKGSIVFSAEAPRKSIRRPMKMPDVCKILGVPYERWPRVVLPTVMSPIH